MKPPAAQGQFITPGNAPKPLMKIAESKIGLIPGNGKGEVPFTQQPGRKVNTWQPVPTLQASQNASGAQRSPPGSPHMRRNSERTDPLPHNAPTAMSLVSAEFEPPVGFFAARAAESVQNISGVSLKAPAFNPHLESPSIRKTAGVDHTKTLPVGKDIVAVSPVTMSPRSDFFNPQADKVRRVGMPVGMASPLRNRTSYKPPQIKRPVEMNVAQ